jgi:hypothetical protein
MSEGLMNCRVQTGPSELIITCFQKQGPMKESEMLEHLRMQKHEWAIGEQELKCRKLEHKVMEQQHQHEREHEY